MAMFQGTAEADTLVGGAENDLISGGDGADSLAGGAGNDQLTGGGGVDTLDGGEGDDRLQDDDVSGHMFGGPGFDILLVSQPFLGGGGSRFADGGDGPDFISMRVSSGPAAATLVGGGGNDEITSIGNTRGVIDAGAGDDWVTLADSQASRLSQTVVVTLGAGSDRLRWDLNAGASGPIVVTDFETGPTGDRVVFALGNHLAGWDGQTNPFSAGFFQLVQVGADAVLRIDYDGAAATSGQLRDIIRFQNVQASAFTAFNTFDWLASGDSTPGSGTTGTDNAEQLTGGNGDDVLSGLGGGDYILGQAGADTVDGGAGDDDVDGGYGSDSMVGGAGNDVVYGDPPGADMGGEDTLQGGEGNDLLDGGVGADLVFGGAGDDRLGDRFGANYLRGDEGNDTIAGGNDFDDINGNMGNDVANGGGGDDWVVGGKDNDRLDGGNGDDIVYGNLGADTCSGGEGHDTVRGGQDDDVVAGDNGNDFISGDRGADTLTGGNGADWFHTFGEAGVDRVADFSLLQGDRVHLDPGTQYTVAQVGADTVISMTGGGQMILVGVQLSALPAGWIFS